MLDVGSRPRDDVMNAHQAGYVAGQVDDWELVNREAHHRMKNTLDAAGGVGSQGL